MKFAKLGVDLLISFLLTLGVSYQVRAHGLHSDTEIKTDNLDNLAEATNLAEIRSQLNQVQVNAFPLVDFPKITSSPRGEAFDFPNVTPDSDPTSVLFGGANIFSIINSTEETNGEFTLLDITMSPGGGAPPHIHHNLAEWFYFVDDGYTVYVSDETYAEGEIPGVNTPKANLRAINAKAGTLLYTPPNRVHAHANTGTVPARELVVAQPSGSFDEWIKLGGVEITDPSNLPALDLEKFFAGLSVSSAFGLTLSSEFDDFVATVSSDFPDEWTQNNQAEELIALLDNNTQSVPKPSSALNTQPVPEPSSALSVLAFGAFCVISILRHKHKSVRMVATAALKITQSR